MAIPEPNVKIFLSLLLANSVFAQTSGDASIRILLGMTDKQPVKWDGSITAGFSTSSPPELHAKPAGAAPFAKVHVIKDSQYVYSAAPGKTQVDFKGRTIRRKPAR